MNKRRYLLKDKNGSATFLDALISIGISVAFFMIFLFYTNSLYTIQDEPGVDLEVKSVGLMETLINSPGRSNSIYPEWQEDGKFEILKALGLGTSKTIQYGTLRILDDNETEILSGPFLNSNSIGIDNTCFLEGTQIVMADESYRSIEDIEVGDLVKSYDEQSNKIVDKKVTHLFHHTPDEMGGHYLVINKQLRVTPNHRFYVGGDWVYADELSIGDSLFYPSTDYSVFSIDRIFERTYTYNFEVEGNHNYFVAMEPTNVLVHNDIYWEGDLILIPGYDPPIGSVPCDVTFTCQVNSGLPPYTYEWDFDDGETYYEEKGNKVDHTHTYTQSGTYNAVLVITDIVGNSSTVTFRDILIYPGPIADFTWFDSDGPYGSGTEICCNASNSSYYGDSATFSWKDDKTSIGSEEVITWDLGDEEIHNIELTITDNFTNSDTLTQQVQANSLTPIEIDSKPWVLTGKEIYPDSDSDTFQSYSAVYYVKYTIPDGEPSDSPFRKFEVKEKTNNEQPVIDIHKIENLTNGLYNNSYNDLKNALGLESNRIMYNFNIKITIYDESGAVDNELIFGAIDNNTLAKASTTRQVLVYYPPTANPGISSGGLNLNSWVIGKHPKYNQAEITISLFIGGTLPETQEFNP